MTETTSTGGDIVRQELLFIDDGNVTSFNLYKKQYEDSSKRIRMEFTYKICIGWQHFLESTLKTQKLWYGP